MQQSAWTECLDAFLRAAMLLDLLIDWHLKCVHHCPSSPQKPSSGPCSYSPRGSLRARVTSFTPAPTACRAASKSLSSPRRTPRWTCTSKPSSGANWGALSLPAWFRFLLFFAPRQSEVSRLAAARQHPVPRLWNHPPAAAVLHVRCHARPLGGSAYRKGHLLRQRAATKGRTTPAGTGWSARNHCSHPVSLCVCR